MQDADGILAEALEIVSIDEVAQLRSPDLFTNREEAYARSKSDPERRLAARLAAKRAAARALGPGLTPSDFEVLPARGAPPQLRLSAAAAARLHALGASRVLVSLTHGRAHAAAAVLVVRDP
jgi:holo-[acyl-carrier protein] synthase